jgi:DNA invertase Pin-like site-specific DNA recombinase
MAEKERQYISQRTREALAAKKAQGVKLGGWNTASIKNRDEAMERAKALRPILAELAGQSAGAIAERLNLLQVPAPKGGAWHAMTVIRLQRRLRHQCETINKRAGAWMTPTR